MGPWGWSVWLGSRLASRAVRLALGPGVELRHVFRSRLLDRLEVVPGELRATRLGALLGVNGRPVLSLEMRSDVAREQLVAAELGGGRSPVMSHLQVRAEASVRLLLQPLDLGDGIVGGADHSEAGLVDELDAVADRRAGA